MGLSKDADMSPFEAGRKLLALDCAKSTLNDRIDLVFQDADLVPLLVQVLLCCIMNCCLPSHVVLAAFRGAGDMCTSSKAVAACSHVQENYVNHKPAIANSEEMHMKVHEHTRLKCPSHVTACLSAVSPEMTVRIVSILHQQ